MRLFLTALTVLALGFAGEASAAGRYGSFSSSRYKSSNSSSAFLYRGYNPGHIFGNTVRRMYWGPQMGPR